MPAFASQVNATMTSRAGAGDPSRWSRD